MFWFKGNNNKSKGLWLGNLKNYEKPFNISQPKMPIKALVIHSYDNMSAVRANSDDEIETLKG